ncbi:MAG: hypothetical protein BWZ04_03172 [Firmicutes bacterium ADurb.BinA205]|nr:MAG: hypothetical protein BWZ04_03172 [Firmicutes bacterium ADurb.BinA205]
MAHDISKYGGFGTPVRGAIEDTYTQAVADSATAAVAADTVLGTAVKGSGWTSGMTLKAHDDAINALERNGTTVAVGGAENETNRDIVLTIKNGAGTPAAVASYAVVGVKVTKANAAGTADSGDPAVINTDLDTVDGLTVVATKGEKIPAGAIADSANASLVAITKADGTLTVNIKKTTTNSKFFVHFILPDGTVKTSAIVELNAP